MSKGFLRRGAVASLLAGGLLSAPAWAGEGFSFSVGLEGRDHATLADPGLPGYPGAASFSDSEGDEPAVSLGAWAGRFGLRVHAMKFQAADSPARVAAFYRRALAAHGPVLDCREPAAREKPPKDSERLSCDESAPPAGEYSLRAGTAKQFRVVHVKPHGNGARFSMARVQIGP